MILNGNAIRERRIISPFSERTRRFGLTYGVGPAGYDVRIDQDLVIPPAGFSLASTLEEFDMPNDVLGIVHDKSTWARLGLAAQNTVIEPGWRGFLTLELTNHNPPRSWWQLWRRQNDGAIVIKRGMPIVQIIFHLLDRPAEHAYSGKYQNQKRGPQPAILEK
ncbi:MAG: dCTP deaminase [Burkholderiaceae bacterium]|nr:dCTP deaminase [Burkholderiaceae bacterium]